MYYIFGIQLIATIFIVVQLMKKLDYDPLSSKRQVYAVICFIILTLSFGLPLVLNYLEPMTRGFVSWIAFYLISASLFLPDLILKDKDRTTLIRLTNYILVYYMVVYVPIFMFNLSNTHSIIVVILKTILLIIVFSAIVLAIRNVYKLIPDPTQRDRVSIGVWVLVIFIAFFGRNLFAQVDVSSYDERETYDVYFDDDYYIAKDYVFEIEGLGLKVHDYAMDDEYIYLYTSDDLVENVKVSLIDKETLEVVKTYDFAANDQEYTWYVNAESDFIFNQDGTIYFPFIDGVYTITDTEVTKISEFSDVQSQRFLLNNKFHIATVASDHFEIYELTPTELVLIDTISKQEGNEEILTVNNHLVIKNTTNNQFVIYPNTTYEVPADMMNYPVISVNDERLFLSNEYNLIRLETGGLGAEFTYYYVYQNGSIELFTTDDYMFELREYQTSENAIIYEVFPRLKTYNKDLSDLYLSVKYESNSFDSKEYSMNQKLLNKNDGFYFMDYKTNNYQTANITIEISEVQPFEHSLNVGVITAFTRESYFIALMTIFIYAGAMNFIPDKKRSNTLFQVKF